MSDKVWTATYDFVLDMPRRADQFVAIKRFKESDEDEQVRKTALREVCPPSRHGSELRHPPLSGFELSQRQPGAPGRCGTRAKQCDGRQP